MPATNLWGTLPQVPEVQPTPISILREQADVITTYYHGVLEGEVETSTSAGKISGVLNIIAPSLGHYKLPILAVTYDIMGYGIGITVYNYIQEQSEKCNTIEQYEQILQSYLSSDRVRNTITKLLEQSRA